MQDMSANPSSPVVLMITDLGTGVKEDRETASTSVAGFNKCGSAQREKEEICASYFKTEIKLISVSFIKLPFSSGITLHALSLS